MLPPSPRPSRSATMSREAAAGPRRVRSVSRLGQRGDEGYGYESGSERRLDRTATSRAIKPQRSLGNMSYSSRSGTTNASDVPPLPPPGLPRSLVPGVPPPNFNSSRSTSYSSPYRDPNSRSGQSSIPPSSRNSPASSSSGSSLASSSGSSFLDRMQKRSLGSTSSQTSFEREPSPRRGKEKWTSPSSESRQETRDDRRGPSDVGKMSSLSGVDSSTQYGTDLWSRITSAAVSLAANVNHAWALNVGTDAGEYPASGRDSHLTKVIKAYHISKASSVADLPDWLFSEGERNQSSKNKEPERREPERRAQFGRETRAGYQNGVSGVQQSRGRQNGYDAPKSSTTYSQTNRSREPNYSGPSNGYGETPGGTKAENRLKALRDAKRAAISGVSRGSSSMDETRQQSGNYMEGPRRYSEDDDQRRRPVQPVPRVGLPARPRRM